MVTLALYIGPAQTIKGHVYERAAIEDWFNMHKTDPMTSEELLTNEVFQDAETRRPPQRGMSEGGKSLRSKKASKRKLTSVNAQSHGDV